MVRDDFWKLVLVIAGLFIAAIILLKLFAPDGPRVEQPSALEGRGEAIVACREALQKLAKHPSTVDFHMLSTGADKWEDGWRVVIDFSAKNAYGLELDYQGVCTVSGDGTVLAGASER